MKISEALETMQSAGVGNVMQAMALVLIDRGHPIEIVTQRMCMSGDTIEQAMWDATLGPAVDSVANYLGLDAFPDEAA